MRTIGSTVGLAGRDFFAQVFKNGNEVLPPLAH